MKIMRFLCILGFLLIGTTTFAADGDMIVNGQVGVGTTSPSTPLEVNGIIKSSTGGVRFPDNTTQTTALPASCTNGQIPKWNGTQWACADDDSGGSGTVSIYYNPNLGCHAGQAITTNSTCATYVCGYDGDGNYNWPLYYNCAASGCNSTSAVTCNNTYVGKLVP